MSHEHGKHGTWHFIRLWKLVRCNYTTTESLPYHMSLSTFIWYHPQMILKNLYFQVCGVIILAISLWMYTNDDIKEYLTIIEYDRSNPYFDAALIVLILVGVFIFLVGFLGCCGAWKENSCLLWLVSTIMKLIDYFWSFFIWTKDLLQ